ncbi:TonB-dependent receptor plug domain-containing protein [soil metagenome]
MQIFTKYSLFLYLFLIYQISFAQTRGAISGLIKSNQGNPVDNAHIALEETSKGAFSDHEGRFAIKDIKPGNYLLKISSVGYITIRMNVEVEAGVTVNINFDFEEDVYSIPQITIISSKDRLFSRLPGSASYVDQKEISYIQPISGNEVFRRVPGVHVVDEEGAGLRVNIGIRGLDPDRSRNVLILEDGIPVALNPYGEPEMYYTPTIDRMKAVEVLKGSGQILYGPQTIGGIINYITADPPEGRGGQARLQGGQNGYFSGLLGYGISNERAGIQVNYLRKQADNIGPTSFRINDINSKIKLALNERSNLRVKIGLYDETSNSTYIGLTQPMYDQGGLAFVRMAPDDQLTVRRYSLSSTYEYALSPRVKLNATAFGYTTTRDWRRQDFSANSNPTNLTGVVWGDENIPGGAIFMRNSTGNRNRQFEVAGIEPKIIASYNLGNLENELVVGTRYLYERAYEQRINGTHKAASSGNLVEDEIRAGKAWSAYAQNKFLLSENLVLTGGLRFESYDYERNILRNTFNSVVRDTNLIASNHLYEVIPGIGLNFKPHNLFNIFAGVHRGFAPPRIKDAITNSGEAYQLDAENSWNYEVGTRSSIYRGVYFELTGFAMNFSNQIISVAESSGGRGAGAGAINGGSTRHVGIETAINVNFGEMLNTAYQVGLDVSGTLQRAEFTGNRFVEASDEFISITGNTTPYAPSVLLSSALTLDAPWGLGLRLTNTYVGEQFTDQLNTIDPSGNGRIGKIPAYHLLDATVIYNIPSIGTSFNIAVKNLTDERYIVSRRPQGIRVGIPRFITAGVNINF